jgi:hypothetical protein
MVILQLPADVYESKDPVTLKRCIDGNCQTTEHSSGADIPRLVRLEATRQKVRVSAEVTGTTGPIASLRDTTLTLKKGQPNGPECPPICYQGQVEVPSTKRIL